MSFAIAKNVAENFTTALVTKQELIHIYSYRLTRDELLQLRSAFEADFKLISNGINFDNLPSEEIEVDVYHLNYLVLQIGLSTALFTASNSLN